MSTQPFNRLLRFSGLAGFLAGLILFVTWTPPAGVLARPGKPGLLQNWSLETYSDYSTDPIRGARLQVATGWQRFVEPIPGAPAPYFMGTDEFDRTWGCHCWVERIEGNNSHALFAQSGQAYIGGIYQRYTAATIGTAYAASGFILSIYKDSTFPPSPVGDGYILKKVGIDPTGGTDPASPAVVWSPEDGTNFRWTSHYVTTRALSTTITVFVRVNSTRPEPGYLNLAILDAIFLELAPTAQVLALPPGSPATFAVSWSGVLPPDAAADSLRFDVQVRTDSGPWTDWITQTTATSATFTGANNHTYYFRARAWAKRAGHPYNTIYGLYADGDGDTHTTVGTAPPTATPTMTGTPTITPTPTSTGVQLNTPTPTAQPTLTPCSLSLATTYTVGEATGDGRLPKGLALDPAAGRLYVGDAVHHRVLVWNTHTDTQVGVIQPVNSPNGLAFDPVRRRLWVSLRDDAGVGIYDVVTAARLATVATGPLPYGLAVDPLHRRVYVANFGAADNGSISVVDADTLSVIATLPVSNYPALVATHPTLGLGYVTSNLSGRLNLVRATGTLAASPLVATGLYGIAVDARDPGRLYAGSRDTNAIYVLDATTGAIQATLPLTTVTPFALAASPAGNGLLLTGRFPLGAPLDQMDLLKIDRVTGQVLGSVRVGVGAEDGLVADAVTGRIYVANNASGTVSVIQDSCGRGPASLPLPLVLRP